MYLENGIEANLYEIASTYQEEVQQIFNEFDEIVSKELHDIGNCLTIKYTIRLTTNVLIVEKMRYHISKEHKWIENQVKIMLENKVIEKLTSLYAFNIVVIRKKNKAEEGMDKLYINYRLLNKIMIPDRYPLPNINKTYS